MENKQLTAVEWLELELSKLDYDKISNNLYLFYVAQIFDQAKAMEKEQIIKSMGIAFNDMLEIQEGKKSPYKDWEQYYNETYGE